MIMGMKYDCGYKDGANDGYKLALSDIHCIKCGRSAKDKAKFNLCCDCNQDSALPDPNNLSKAEIERLIREKELEINNLKYFLENKGE